MMKATNTINDTLPGGNLLLKTCIFATGLSGIVAEYVMATLASYMLGNSVVQWTMTLSVMLFAMGVGSRLSKHLSRHLLDQFIVLELSLSLLCALSATSTYLVSANVQWIGPYIYSVSFAIGVLIGLEIPIAARLNEVFEDLRVNISSVMEKDYYGALLGGLVFAFLALPYLGLTYTPIVLGMVNFAVAAALYVQHRRVVHYPRRLLLGFLLVAAMLAGLLAAARPIILYGEQQKYVDQVIYQQQTPYQRIVITRHKGDFWLYLNGNQQFSSYDEERYHEPLVHPAMQAAVARGNVLVLGGGDGLAAREILKYPDVTALTLVDLDPEMTRLGREHPLFVDLNQHSLHDKRVVIHNRDAYSFLQEENALYDVIFIDLPDPKTVGLARLYSREFYQLVSRHLGNGGVVVTQAVSPFFALDAFLSILKTMRAAGFSAIAYHNHIPTLGEWGWVLGMKSPQQDHARLQQRIESAEYGQVPTRFLNRDAVISMTRFGKGVLERLDDLRENNELDLILYQYYQNGDWNFY